MKKATLIIICGLAFVLGFAAGHHVGLQRAFHKIGDEMERDQLLDANHAEELEARGYLYSLRALDSGRPEDIAALRKRAMGHLRAYVQSVQDLHDLGGWRASDLILSNVTVYLAEHPHE